MRMKGLCAILVFVLSFVCFTGPVFASKWVHLGKQILYSGEVRVDYLDADSVVKDDKAGTMVYWVLSEIKNGDHEFKKTTKYQTQLDELQRTRYLEWHVYDRNNNLRLEGNQPQSTWQDVEETTVLDKAIEMASEIAEVW